MRVHRVVVDPVAVVVARKVHLAGSDHRVLVHPIDVVFVHGQRVGERVVLLHLLQLTERRRHDLRVEQADLRGRLGVLLQRALGALRRGLVFLGLHGVEPIGGARGVDIALDVRRFHLLRVRIDTEALQQHGPQRGQQQRQHNGRGDGDGRHAPCLPRGDEPGGTAAILVEQARAHEPDAKHHAHNHRDHRHDDDHRDVRMHRRVGGAGDAVALRGHRREDRQHLIGRPGDHPQHEPDGDLTACARRHREQAAPMDRHAEPDAAHRDVRAD